MGEIIAGRFELGEVIGQGGMGLVYHGHDLQLEQDVAIKTIKKEVMMEDPELMERFEREGEALRQLNHPNIVKMISTVQENEEYYLVLEYVEGGSLLDLLRKSPQLPIERILQIGLDLADALTRAHRLKIIHRDIKPANILLTKDGVPRLTDFGVARIGKTTLGTITKTGAVVGTYSYLSPEACEGKRVDARTDIWSFGVVLYEMLAGRRPFEADTQTAVLLDIMTKPVPDILEFRPDTPPQLISLILRMLEKDKEKRISSVRLVGAELEAILEMLSSGIRGSVPPGDPGRFRTPTPSPSPFMEGATITPGSSQNIVPQSSPSAVLPSSPAKSRRWIGIGAGIAALVIAAGVLALLGGTGGEDQSKAPEAAPTSAIVLVDPVAPGENMVLVANLENLASEERDVKRFILEDLTNRLETGAPVAQIRIRDYNGLITSEEQAVEAAQANGAHLIVWGNYDDEVINLNISPGVVETSLFDRSQIEESIAVRLRIEDPRRQTIVMPVASAMVLIHTIEDRAFEAAISLLVVEQYAANNDFEVVSAGVSANFVRYFSTYFTDPDTAIEEMTAGLRIDGSNPVLYLQRGNILANVGRYTEAERDFNSALRLTNEQWAIAYVLLANNAVLLDNIQAAIARYTQAIEIEPNDWFPYSARGSFYYLEGDYANARADLEQSIGIGANSAIPYITSNMLAIREGRINDSIALLNTVLTDFPDPTLTVRLSSLLPGGESTNNRYFTVSTSAFSNMVLGQYEAAIENADEALAIRDDIADLYMLKGVAYCILGEYEEAEAVYSQGIEREPDFTMLYLLRAEVRNKQGNLAGSLEDFQVAQQSDIWPNVEAILAESDAGALGCASFFGG
ncbi:MAG: protein kinase [Anaerolineae bacterium]|nr:protein kinase [Anaerolineae bacterium]